MRFLPAWPTAVTSKEYNNLPALGGLIYKNRTDDGAFFFVAAGLRQLKTKGYG